MLVPVVAVSRTQVVGSKVIALAGTNTAEHKACRKKASNASKMQNLLNAWEKSSVYVHGGSPAPAIVPRTMCVCVCVVVSV